jgi:deoxyribonuclease-2
MRIALLVFSFLGIVAYPVCRSDSGGAVDIWTAFKGPKGTSYAYADSQTILQASAHSMNSTSVGALGLTLGQLWSESSTEYIMWNDSPPGAANYNYTVGHAKGIWAWNVDTGDAIIVQHSVPQFPKGPATSSKYVGLGSNAWTYGQHAACFHTTISELVRLAPLAELTVPGIYDTRISSQTPSALRSLASGGYSVQPDCSSVYFSTAQGINITYFAKSTQWNNELYAWCLAPGLQTSLQVESWIRGSAEGPACGGLYKVLDVQSVSFPGGLDFSEVNDHSKWAVGDGVFCASDINRMTTQYARGGGAYCWSSPLVSDMTSVVKSTDNC